MLRKPLLLAAIYFTATIVAACGVCSKKITCPQFNDEVLISWFPYQDEEQSKFMTSTGGTQLFTIDTIANSNPYQMYGDERKCASSRDAESKEKDAKGKPVFSFRLLKSGYYETSPQRSANMRLFDFPVSIDGIKNDGFASAGSAANTQVQTLNSVNLDGKKFYNIQVIQIDTAGPVKPAVHRIYIAKNQGLVGYETYSPALLWVKQ